MRTHPQWYLAAATVLATVAVAPAQEVPPSTSSPASAPASRLHCVVVNEAGASAPGTRILVHTMGPAGWIPMSGESVDEAGSCDLAFPGSGPGPMMLEVSAPGYQNAEACYLPDPVQVIPWMTITLKGDRTLQGTVVTQDRQPVPDADVTLDSPAGPRQTKTDAQGRFELRELMPIRSRVDVEVPGLGRGTYRVDLTRQVDPITIVIQPQRKVTLRITDTEDKPLPDLSVQILSPRKAEGRTDEDGRMLIPGMGAEAARVRITLDDKFYCLPRPVMTINVPAGEQPEELQLQVSRGGQITGRVVEVMEDGQLEGIPAASVWLVEEGRIGRSVTCDEDGNFEMNAVPPGTWLVAAGHPTYALAVSQEEVKLGEQTTVQFSLGPGATIQGMVVDIDGKPVERAIIRVLAWYPKGQKVPRLDAPMPVELPWRGTRSGAEGEYVLENIPPGRIAIEAAAEDGTLKTYVNIQVKQDKDVIESTITLRAGEAPPPI